MDSSCDFQQARDTVGARLLRMGHSARYKDTEYQMVGEHNTQPNTNKFTCHDPLF